MTNLILGTATIGSTEAGYLSGLTAGTAANSKALVLSNTGSITGITSLTTGTINASTYQQDGTTYSLASFLTAVPSSFTSSGTITAGTVNATTYRQSGTTYNLASFLTAVPSSFTSSGTITAGTVNATTYQQGGTTYNLANMLTTSTSSILLGGTLSANTVSCTNLTQNGVSYNLASFLTSIPSSLSLSSLTVSGTGAQFNTSAGNTDSIYLPVGSYAMYLRNNSNIISTSVGLAFLNDSSGAYSTTTPSATISTLRRSSTQYDGSDIEFYTKGSASQTGALYRLASLHGTTGQLSIGSNNGYMDLNILKDNAGASIRIGSYQSTANCFTITYSYVGSSYAQNRLQFDNYGFSGQQCWFGDNSVAINSQDVPPAKFAIKGDTTKMYGSWDREVAIIALEEEPV
ncbi:hypothetical protein PC110_g7964 [Phytophthora cactorum]|uniref:Uncharacterized protein n=1 Tax=Phytophthora cactorum TaxID=29920 RepID=A0A329SGS2_9STRA|nr:hypothetical protein PC110_g7964 [Phytophthora cactorum]